MEAPTDSLSHHNLVVMPVSSPVWTAYLQWQEVPLRLGSDPQGGSGECEKISRRVKGRTTYPPLVPLTCIIDMPWRERSGRAKKQPTPRRLDVRDVYSTQCYHRGRRGVVTSHIEARLFISHSPEWILFICKCEAIVNVNDAVLLSLLVTPGRVCSACVAQVSPF